MSSNPVSGIPALTVTVHTQEGGGVVGELLGYGLLTSKGTVLVPDPPEALANPWRRFSARISPPPGSGENGAVVPVGGVSMAALEGDGITTAAAVLTLVWDEPFAVATVSVTSARLAEALLRNHGDQWATYAELGFRVVRPEAVGPPDTWWRKAPEAETGVTGSAGDYAKGTCCSSRVCCRAPSRKAADAGPAAA
ncbi:hypothetical protein GCM10009639_64340 [Kitasatospora putterlickiae]|uniref:Uncharacterized protein n=1 Tax=Kitasatospora putterlickiae TaxID=221725 RepID=A0ABN1YLD9_9ACTN